MATRTTNSRTARALNTRRATAQTARVRPTVRPVEDDPAENHLDAGRKAEPAPHTVAKPQPARVIVDGIEYAPAGTAPTGVPKVGIGVTTRNRNELVQRVLESIRAHTPAEFPIIVVDDASEKPVAGADWRFDTNVGVARAKNKALDLLWRHPYRPDHYLLLDDDVMVKSDDWWRPYVESPEPHLAHSWGLQKLWDDDQHVAWHASGGTVLYYTRQVIDDVGGMESFSDPDQPGSWGCDHVALSDRIFNRGWTSSRYMDVVGADLLFDELDRNRQRNGHQSTATAQQREFNSTIGRELWKSRIETDDAYVEYRDLDDVIITHLLTGGSAAKSGRRYKPTTDLLATLAKSITHGRLVVLHDQLDDPKLTCGNGRPVEFVKVESPQINVFYARHLETWRWLRDHETVGRVWAVDGTDVEMLRDPFDNLQPGKIHVGWEPRTQTAKWMVSNHPERRYQEFAKANPDLMLLNAGLIGGDRSTMLAFLHDLIRYQTDVAIDWCQIWGQPRQQATVGPGDMGGLQVIGYSERWRDKLITGPKIATVFKAEKVGGGEDFGTETSIWRHK